ncbi:MAG TPA: hypothetical protein VGG61_09180 [Gemmataceae bacterium]|jgi:ribosomal protein L37AE/L43A
MPIIVQCPACGRKLRVPDELLGKIVKCPGCGGTFTGEAKTSAPEPEQKAETPPNPSRIAALDDLDLELEEEPAPPPPPPPAPAPPPPSPPPSQRPRKEEIVRPETAPEPVRPKPVSKPKPRPREEEDDGKEPCPSCGERIKRDSIRCKYCGEEFEDDDEYEEERPSRRGRKRGRGVRRDSLPHRGGMVLTLGIISVVSVVLDVLLSCCCLPAGWVMSLVGLGTGIPAWILGQRDLAKMRTGEMDPTGKGSTQGGWICGMIGTILSVLILVGSVIFIAIYGAAIMSGAMMNPGGGGNQNPFGPQPGPGRKFSAEPGALKLWHYLPSREMNMLPTFGR